MLSVYGRATALDFLGLTWIGSSLNLARPWALRLTSTWYGYNPLQMTVS